MKTLFIVLLLLVSELSFTQEFFYQGQIDKSVISKLTTKELIIYAECISTIGKDGIDLNWVTNKTTTNFKKNNNYYRANVVSYDLKKNKFKINPILGKSIVPFEQFLFYIKRTKSNTIIKIYNFY